MKQIGRILSGSTIDEIYFVVLKGKKVRIGGYYLIEHPLKHSLTHPCYVLLRVFDSYPYNPEMKIGSAGPLAGSRGINFIHGKHIEYFVALAEPLGYYDNENKKFRSLETVPSTWALVYEPSKELLNKLLGKGNLNKDGVYLPIGKTVSFDIPIYLDLGAVAKGHLFIAGMTRSGKSSFVVNMIKNSMETFDPPPRFVVLDRRGEYGVLSRFGAKVFSYRCFLPKNEVLEPYVVVDRLGLNKNTSVGKLVRDSVIEVLNRKMELTPKNLLTVASELSYSMSKRNSEKDLDYLEWTLKVKGGFLKKKKEKELDIIEMIYKEPVVVIDYSLDSNLDDQYITTREIIKKIVRYGIKRRKEGDFAVILVVEEAQYFIPEKTAPILGSPSATKVDKVFIEAISQAGGYNIGFVVVTQRPAYVSKCVPEHTEIILQDKLVPIKELFEEVKQYSERVKVGNEEILFPSRQLTLPYINKELAVKEAVVQALMKKKEKNLVLDIETKDGFRIECTPKHKLYILSRNQVKETLASNVKKGMKILRLKNSEVSFSEVEKINERRVKIVYDLQTTSNRYLAGEGYFLVHNSVISQCNTVLCFRLKSGNDQDAVIRYTEYGGNYMKRYLSGLATHEALGFGLGITAPFPILLETKVDVFPEKASQPASEAWKKMAEQRRELLKVTSVKV